MTVALATLLLIFGFCGHVVFWVILVNRLHAVSWNRLLLDDLTNFCGIALVTLPLIAAGIFWKRGTSAWIGPWDGILSIVWGWIIFMNVLLVAAAFHKLWLALHSEKRGGLLANHTNVVDIRKHLEEPLTAPGFPRLLGCLPGNQIGMPRFHEKQILIPRLQDERAGIKIVHLSDLHMSGRITKRYFSEVVERVNQWQPDIIALTGDLIECPACIDWIPDTIGRLRATYGVFFVLGNHDRNIDEAELRPALTATGLHDLGGRGDDCMIRQTPVVLAGNELPWYHPAVDLADCPRHDEDGVPVRILLAHTPDQFRWAQQQHIDLMLAGHCHGGQVCLPLVGAVLAPSWHGTRYAAGVFQADQTILHVSRGAGELTPFRWNCPSEVALLTLRGKPTDETRRDA